MAASDEENSEVTEVDENLQLFFDSASAILEELPLRVSDDCQASLLQIELLLKDITVLVSDGYFDGVDDEHVVSFSSAIQDLGLILSQAVDDMEVSNFRRAFVNMSQNSRGRPCIYIPRELLHFLKENNFKNTEIARMLLVSPKTISRRIHLYGLQSVSEFSNIPDDQLIMLAADFVRNYPFSGQRSFEGYLRSHSLKIQRSRIRDALFQADPRGVQERKRKCLHRRVYSVHMPNSLWHIDTNHKLIRWNFVIFGGIDGYSRVPVFLEVHNNNKSSTMLDCFMKGVAQYGLPSRVRCDKGSENVRVSDFMINERGPGRGSCIVGRSVHNQRIERFWRDLFTGCISLFYHVFYYLEDLQMLSHTNILDLFSLHYVFRTRISHHLQVFCETYINHRLRTEHNSTPLQLWLTGMTTKNDNDVIDMLNFDIESSYGIDWDGPVSFNDNTREIVVPDICCPLNDEQLSLLHQNVDILEETSDYGIGLYLTVRDFVYSCSDN